MLAHRLQAAHQIFELGCWGTQQFFISISKGKPRQKARFFSNIGRIQHMANLFLRGLFIPAAVAIIGLSGCASTGKGGPDKAVYHINDSSNASALLRNIGNHLEVDPTAKIVVVSHALGVDFLMDNAKDKNGNPYNIGVERLAGKGVTFDVCEITLKGRALKKEQFISEVKFVPSGVAEIAKLQSREGYVYLKP